MRASMYPFITTGSIAPLPTYLSYLLPYLLPRHATDKGLGTSCLMNAIQNTRLPRKWRKLNFIGTLVITRARRRWIARHATLREVARVARICVYVRFILWSCQSSTADETDGGITTGCSCTRNSNIEFTCDHASDSTYVTLSSCSSQNFSLSLLYRGVSGKLLCIEIQVAFVQSEQEIFIINEGENSFLPIFFSKRLISKNVANNTFVKILSLYERYF